MFEITIHGRGGQGGVTLAKLIASAYFVRGKHVQAFGVYAAERSGAPLQAFVRVDDREITNHNQVRTPDHVIVLDQTLISSRVTAGLRDDGWIILNTSERPDSFGDRFAGRRVATVDATSIAVAHGLGTRTVPIVNTTLLGAVAKVFELSWDVVGEALDSLKFGEPNLEAAKQAFDSVARAVVAGERVLETTPVNGGRAASVLDEDVGGLPAIHTGQWATRRPHRQRLTPPCNHSCPAGNDVQGFVAAVGQENPAAALNILLETTPLPSVCGRVCPAPCMEACNRNSFDEGVNVRDLERFVGDVAVRPEPTAPWRDARVAVVGSGPAGLSAAYSLARVGYPVTLFESEDELGGVLRTGIPAYRLPRAVLDREIDWIMAHGIEPCVRRRIGRRELVALTHDHAAVFVGTGLQHVRDLELGVDGRGRVEQGIAFLDRVRHHDVSLFGEYVVVVGGGNTAIDSARTALRLGATRVHVIYRRTRAEMPAIAEEIDEALEEGVVLDELVSPVRLHNNGACPVLTCQRMYLGEPDESGRRRPVPEVAEDAYFDLHCHRVVLAVGQMTDLSILPEGSEVRDGDGLIGLSGGPVFLGGDFLTNEGTVAAAIGSGRKAAWHIHQTLTGEQLFGDAEPEVAGREHIMTHVFEHSPRLGSRTARPASRRRSFTEVRLGFDDESGQALAVEEARRCFSCGVCNECDRCVTHCPEGILFRDGDGYHFDYDYCKGCGICATQCPRGVIYMAEL